MRAGQAVLLSILLAASSGAALEAEPPRSRVELGLRLAPPGALVFRGREELPLRQGRNGIRWASLEPGPQELLILAEGCVARRISLELPPPSGLPARGPLLLEEKLERAGSPLELERMGPTGLRPKSLAFSPDGRFLVVPLLSGRGADLLDAASLAPLGRLEPPLPFAASEGFVECAFFPRSREIWVSQMHSSRIHAFDLDSFAYKDSFPSGGSYPKVIASSPDGSRAYVSNWVSEDVCVIETSSRRILARIKTGGTPRGLAPSPDGRWLYIARFSDGAILRLDLASMELATFHAPDGGAKRHLVLDPDRGRLYATDMGRGSLFAFDCARGRLLAELRLGPNPNGCALSPDGRLIYACTRGPDGEEGYERKGPVAGELIAIDARRLAVVARQWGGAQPTGLAVSPDGSRILFTDFLDHRVESYRASGFGSLPRDRFAPPSARAVASAR
ncbi:MAG TPA: YncE family protein [Spirochaetia bacterium]|nr:YncE family protein [Spirochaetia bacterium]